MQFSVSVCSASLAGAPIIFQGDLLGGIRQAAQLGYDAVELHIPDFDAVDLHAVLALLQQTGLAVSGLSPALAFGRRTLSLADTDERVRAAALARLERQIDVACLLGAANVMVGLIRARFVSSDPALLHQQRAWAAQGLRRADAYAAERGARLAIEAINRYETNYLNRAAEVVELITSHGLRASSVLLDTFHMNIEEVSIEEAIATTGKLLAYVHCPDSNRRSPGFGHLPFGAVMAALRKAGYRGYLAMELLPWPDAQTAAQQALRQARELVHG